MGLDKPLEAQAPAHAPAIPFGSGDVMMMGVALIWGVGFTIVKFTVGVFPPTAFNAVRTTLAALILLGVLRARGERLRDAGRDWRALVVLGVVGYFGYLFFFVSGIARTTASNSSILVSTMPVLVAALNGLFGFERVRPRAWLGVLISFSGIALIVVGGGGGLDFGSESFVGDGLTLAAALAWAGFVVFSKPYLARHSALLVTTWAVGTSALCLWLAALPALGSVAWASVPPAAWLGVLYAGGVGISGAYLLWNLAAKRVGGTRAAVYSNLVTVVAVIVAAITLGEAITTLKVAGAVAVFGGIALTHWREGSARREPV